MGKRIVVLFVSVFCFARACEFDNETLCELCVGDDDACSNAISGHCSPSNWQATSCEKYLVSCPFATTMRTMAPSPCGLDVCVGQTTNATLCLSAISEYCTFELVQANTNGGTAADTACDNFIAVGCSAQGSIFDCNGDCVLATTLNNNACDTANNCDALNHDGGDCDTSPVATASTTQTPTPAPPTTSRVPCCTDVTKACCACQTSNTQAKLCADCQSDMTSASTACCNLCSSPQSTTVTVSYLIPNVELSDFTETVLLALRTGFANLCSQEGMFIVTANDVTVTIRLLTNKQQSVVTDYSVTLPSIEAAQDALVVLEDEDRVLEEVNDAISDSGSSFVLPEITYQNTTNPFSSSGGGDDGDDHTGVIVGVVVAVVVVLSLVMVGLCCVFNKKKDASLSPELTKQTAAQAAIVEEEGL